MEEEDGRKMKEEEGEGRGKKDIEEGEWKQKRGRGWKRGEKGREFGVYEGGSTGEGKTREDALVEKNREEAGRVKRM